MFGGSVGVGAGGGAGGTVGVGRVGASHFGGFDTPGTVGMSSLQLKERLVDSLRATGVVDEMKVR